LRKNRFRPEDCPVPKTDSRRNGNCDDHRVKRFEQREHGESKQDSKDTTGNEQWSAPETVREPTERRHCEKFYEGSEQNAIQNYVPGHAQAPGYIADGKHCCHNEVSNLRSFESHSDKKRSPVLREDFHQRYPRDIMPSLHLAEYWRF
jgi:hypothetical protein